MILLIGEPKTLLARRPGIFVAKPMAHLRCRTALRT